MPIEKSFRVFGDPIDVVLRSTTSDGLMSSIIQTCEPGGEPPPHVHRFEDEFFFPVEGSWEMFNGESWTPLTATGHFAQRGHVHTFRNAGTSAGKILCVVNRGDFVTYLEKISTLQIPQDMEKLIAISEQYGIRFVQAGEPVVA